MPLWTSLLLVCLGTISENGLCTLRTMVPNYPTITVKTNAEADLGESVSAIDTIVTPDLPQHTARH